MILLIKFSGGLGITYQGSVDISTLPDELKQSVQTHLSEKALADIKPGESNRNAADTMTYELQYQNSKQRFILNEGQASEGTLEAIDRLRPYLILDSKSKKS